MPSEVSTRNRDTSAYGYSKIIFIYHRYDIVGLHLSSDSRHCFAAGLDNELIFHSLNAEVTKVARSKRDTVVPQSLPSGSLLHQVWMCILDLRILKGGMKISEVNILFYQNHRVFRSEAQWAGVSLWKGKGSKEDYSFTVVGYSTSGKLYVLRYKRTKSET